MDIYVWRRNCLTKAKHLYLNRIYFFVLLVIEFYQFGFLIGVLKSYVLWLFCTKKICRSNKTTTSETKELQNHLVETLLWFYLLLKRIEMQRRFFWNNIVDRSKVPQILIKNRSHGWTYTCRKYKIMYLWIISLHTLLKIKSPCIQEIK